MSFHDTHFHLDLFPDPPKIISRIEEMGIYTIAVTNAPSVFYYTLDLTKNRKYIRAALGLHPELAYERQNELTQFLSYIDQTRFIGEVGLDNYDKSPDNYNVQKKVFEKIVNICRLKENKILTIHSRRAAKDVITMIGQDFPGKIILHWYSGSLKDLQKALEYGFYFSVNYAMTQSENGKKIIQAVPMDRMLLETDGPFTEYENLPSTPIVTKTIAKKINLIKQLNLELTEIEFLFNTNFINLLS